MSLEDRGKSAKTFDRILEEVRHQAKLTVQEGIGRAFPDLWYEGRRGVCKSCSHRWNLHNLPLYKRNPNVRMLPCHCCDKHLKVRSLFR